LIVRGILWIVTLMAYLQYINAQLYIAELSMKLAKIEVSLASRKPIYHEKFAIWN